jgi:hypothetical protein
MSVIEGVNINVEFESIYKKVELKHLAELQRSEDGTVDAEDEEDVMYLCEEVYREEFLKFFRVHSFEESVINARVNELFKIVKKEEKFTEILRIFAVKHSIFNEDLEQAFMQLFAYQFFHLTHECIKQLFFPDDSRDLSFELLKNAVMLLDTE